MPLPNLGDAARVVCILQTATLVAESRGGAFEPPRLFVLEISAAIC